MRPKGCDERETSKNTTGLPADRHCWTVDVPALMERTRVGDRTDFLWLVMWDVGGFEQEVDFDVVDD